MVPDASALQVGSKVSQRRTRLIATLGPSTDSEDVMRGLIRAGLDVARINTAHGGAQEIRRRADLARRCAADVGRDIALLLDLQGPKIRVGALRGESQVLTEGETVSLVATGAPADEETCIPIDYPPLAREVRPGQPVLLSDGMLRLEAIDSDGAHRVRCRVLAGGVLRTHKGVNLPETTLSIETPTDKDLQDARIGLEAGVDFLGLSFVRRAADVERLRTAIDGAASIVAKIERPEALAHIDEIVHAADAVMVARGDLGVELPLEDVPQAQLAILHAAQRVGTPAIVATELLESMQVSERPTRAEVTDVFYAVSNRTDAVMLSAESAVGQHPVAAVQTLGRLARAAEATLTSNPQLPAEGNQTTWVAYSAVMLAHALQARAIVIPTTSGLTARQVARFRPGPPMLAIVENARIARQLALTWGVTPLVADMPHETAGLIRSALRAVEDAGYAHEGEPLVLTTGVPVGRAGSTNLIKVHRLGEAYI
jgi:pyruvate kinase